MRTAYLDCFSGISGDMFLGALVDAGVSPDLLRRTVEALDIGAGIEFSRVDRNGITGTKVDVIVEGEKDLPREVFHEREHKHDHEHEHNQPHEHSHEHGGHTHEHGHLPGHHHEHKHSHGRSLKDIRHIIAHASISAMAKQRATSIFEALGRAEAKIHNKNLETIHFHEVGSADAIVDIVCAAVGSEALGVDEWVCSPLNVGSGTVVCAHGTLPVPAPATVELLQSCKAPVFSSGIQKELVTPTGAAIISILASRFGTIPSMTIEKTGYGAGYRDLPGQPNVLRLSVGEQVAAPTSSTDFSTCSATSAFPSGLPIETISVLEATIDDMTAQMFGYFLERAFEAGALDAYVVPVQMKKNRPGMLLTVLARPDDRDRLARLIFAETTTIGLRVREEHRYALERKFVKVETKWGPVRMKIAALDGTDSNCAPEYEDCRRIAVEHGIPLKNVMREAVRAYMQSLERNHE